MQKVFKIVCKIFFCLQTVCIFAYIYEQKYTNRMKVSALIIEKLLTDKKFRLSTALALGVTERNVQQLAERNSDNLTKMAAVNYYKSTGLTDAEIFETESQTA